MTDLRWKAQSKLGWITIFSKRRKMCECFSRNRWITINHHWMEYWMIEWLILNDWILIDWMDGKWFICSNLFRWYQLRDRESWERYYHVGRRVKSTALLHGTCSSVDIQMFKSKYQVKVFCQMFCHRLSHFSQSVFFLPLASSEPHY